MPIDTAWRDIPLLGPRRRPTVRSVGRGSRRRWISRVRAVFPVSRYGLRGCGTHSRVRIESQTVLSLPVAGVSVKRLRTLSVPLSAHWSTSATFLAGARDVRPRLQHLRGCPGWLPAGPAETRRCRGLSIPAGWAVSPHAVSDDRRGPRVSSHCGRGNRGDSRRRESSGHQQPVASPRPS